MGSASMDVEGEQSPLTVQQYPDEDTRPTSKKEILGWYTYSWAAEAFTVCAMGSFLPITLEQMARDRGFLLSDKRTPCNAISNVSLTITSRYDEYRALNAAQCIVYIFGAEAIVIISMSGAADHGNHRKALLAAFAFVGSIATMLFLVVVPEIYLFGSLLAIVANTCFGASFVLLNSFLPLLIRHHPLVRGASEHDQISESTIPWDASSPSVVHGAHRPAHSEISPLLQPSHIADMANETALGHCDAICGSTELTLSTQISSYGIGIGYTGAVVLQAVSIIVVAKSDQTTFSLHFVLFLIGLWWFVFTIPAVVWLRRRSGPPLPLGRGMKQPSWIDYMAYSWKSLGRTIAHARGLKDIVLFLMAWLLLSDSIATIGGTAVLFAKTELGMQPAALGLISVVTMGAGVFGAFSWGHVSRRFNLRASQTIVACIILFELVPLYGLLGFIPAIKRLGFLGLQQPWEMYPMGAVYGLVMGGLSSYCRSLFGELIPPGYEAAFYSLYAITDKGSSIFGPAIVGAITDRYGGIRPGFIFLAVLIVLPLPLMLLLDVERGKKEAVELSGRLRVRDEAGYNET